MKEINTKEFAYAFCDMLEGLMQQFTCVGEWDWGNPAGITGALPTYELTTQDNQKVWCALVEYVNAGTFEKNRKGILATFPVDKKQSLGSEMATIVPYEFSRKFNTLAYHEGDDYEIRNYGKVTAGRAAIKRTYFFDHMNRQHPDLIFIDEEERPYINVYKYSGELSKEQFAEQTYNITKLLSDFKKQYHKEVYRTE